LSEVLSNVRDTRAARNGALPDWCAWRELATTYRHAVRLFKRSYARRRAQSRMRMLRRSGEGQSLGWFLEKAGIRLARLTEPQFVDMFWIAYRVTPMPGVSWQTLANSDLWVTSASVRFRNAGTGDVAPYAFQGGRLPTTESPFVVMRALYIECPTRLQRAYDWAEEHPLIPSIVLAVLLLALTTALRVGARELFRLTIVD
jgi:hypothetical protein